MKTHHRRASRAEQNATRRSFYIQALVRDLYVSKAVSIPRSVLTHIVSIL